MGATMFAGYAVVSHVNTPNCIPRTTQKNANEYPNTSATIK
jgi:hypothetical protein